MLHNHSNLGGILAAHGYHCIGVYHQFKIDSNRCFHRRRPKSVSLRNAASLAEEKSYTLSPTYEHRRDIFRQTNPSISIPNWHPTRHHRFPKKNCQSDKNQIWVDGCVEGGQLVRYSASSRTQKRGRLFSEQFQLTPLILTSHRLHTNVIRGSISKEITHGRWCHSKQPVHWTVGIYSSSTEVINLQGTISVVLTHH